MSEWVHGDGWRYHLLSAVVFMIVGLPVAVANALFDWPIGVTYAAGLVAGTIICLFGERKYIGPIVRGERTRAESPQRH